MIFFSLSRNVRLHFSFGIQEAEDHCSPTPCVEGSCLNTPGGYYCHCPPDRAGRHCELLATPCKSPPCYGNFYFYLNGLLVRYFAGNGGIIHTIYHVVC